MVVRGRLLVTLVVVLAALTQSATIAALLAADHLIGLAGAGLPASLETGPQATIVFDRHDRPVFTFHTEQRIDVALDEVSPHLVGAVLAVEDRRFHSHAGLDPFRIVGAAWTNLRAGRVVEGGSTISQQLARALALNRERTFRRKFREVFLAAQLEARYRKREILQAYLNKVYFGDGYYGVEAAARGYFGKTATELTPAESAMLAGLIKSPSRYSPSFFASRARGRRDLVLRRMLDQKRLEFASYRTAVAAPLGARPRRNDDEHRSASSATEAAEPCGLYFKEEVRLRLIRQFGARQVFEQGLRVYATIDSTLQCEAERAIGKRLWELHSARRAPARRLDVALVLPANELQGSLVSLDPRSGHVLAMVGGSDFHTHHYNRATQARRQPGSAFKPLIFAAALERGYTPSSLLQGLETPIQAAEGAWLPSGEHEAAQYTLRRALKVSSNRASARLLQQIGPAQAVAYARRLGVDSRLPAVPSLALGTGEVTLLELTSAYGVFANKGLLAPPVFIRRVEDRWGRVLWDEPRATRRATSAATAFLITNMLSDVINGGTAYRVRAMGFRQPAAGKTGTTDNFADTWFVGYTPRLVTGVWFGFDQPTEIMRRGFAATVAVPAWTNFMKRATAGDPPEEFEMPPDIERVAVCRLSGRRAVDGCRNGVAWSVPHLAGFEQTPVSGPSDILSAALPAIPAGPAPQPGVYEDFTVVGTVPLEKCPLHGAPATDVAPTHPWL